MCDDLYDDLSTLSKKKLNNNNDDDGGVVYFPFYLFVFLALTQIDFGLIFSWLQTPNPWLLLNRFWINIFMVSNS